jgi:hypothetical protein
MKIKHIIYTLAIFLCLSTLASCTVHSHGRGHRGMPPGKAKKIYGTKSARPFAPGQQKKKHSKLKNQKKKHKGPGKHKAKKQNRHSVYFVPVWKY